ncbi:MAG: M20/M25/M40 family metallo-hydrolase [Gemmatimonadota bacterium]
MSGFKLIRPFSFVVALTLISTPLLAQRGGGRGGQAQPDPFPTTIPADDARITALKREAIRMVDSMSTTVQQIVDMLFSFSELGMQETETERYLTGLLQRNGFTIERGVGGMPTAWVAKWGTGKPVLALGSDIDGIPQANQKPGVAYRDPIVVGAPGHGEGHNSGQAVNIVAAFALKRIMERERIPGTIVIWPGVAEEQMAGKAYLVRAGVFRDADAALFTHVGNGFGVSWGQSGQMALISAEFNFRGESAHAAGAPWRGRSAADAATLMDVMWNFRREHLPLNHRSHSVITNGGDQPNVVPPTATIWYFFRESNTPLVKSLFALGDTLARAAAMGSGTGLESVRVLGSGWSGHFNKPIAEATANNIRMVGLPTWSEADQTLARSLQCELGDRTPNGLSSELGNVISGPSTGGTGGGSDDIGDVSWNLPTVTLRYPSNIPGLPGHNWSSAIASATPIAHKGAVAGAKVQAATMIDLYTKPTILEQAKRYFSEVQTKDTKYEPLMRDTDQPPTHLNQEIMARYKPELQKHYYDPSKFKTYLDQLGITYPTVKPCPPVSTD